VQKAAASILARTLRSDVGALVAPLEEALEALIGRAARIEPIAPGRGDLARLFGGRDLFIFPFVGSTEPAPPIFLAMDLPAAISAGAAYGFAHPDEARRALASGVVPPALCEAIGEVASIMAGTLAGILRGRAAAGMEIVVEGIGFRRRRVGPWPEIVAEVDGTLPWEARGFRLLLEGSDAGALLVAASDGRTGVVRLSPDLEELDTSEIPPEEGALLGTGVPGEAHGEETAVTRWIAAAPPGTQVLVCGPPGDGAVAGLRVVLEEEGCEVLPGNAAAPTRTASALFIVSRSAADMRARLTSMTAIRRPPLVIACSDRPTIDLVRAARDAAADSFLVLPADRTRVRELFRRLVEAAVS